MPTRANSEIIIYHRPLPGGLGLLSSCALEFWLSFRVPLCNTLGLRWCGHENQDIRWKWKATVSKLDIKNLGQFSVFIRYCCNLRGDSWMSTFPESSRSWFCIIFFLLFSFFGRGGEKSCLFFMSTNCFFFFLSRRSLLWWTNSNHPNKSNKTSWIQY